MTDQLLQRAAKRVQDSLDEILANFKPGAKITVLVRTPGKPTADFCMTDDSLDEVIAMVQRRKGGPAPETREQALIDRLNVLEAALRRISKWFGEFPETGRFWDDEKTRQMTWAACYGSNGERDYMRGIAEKALSVAPALPSPETPLQDWTAVPAEMPQALMRSINFDNQVLAYENGRYFNAWLQFEASEGGWFWMDEADSEPNPSHYMALPAEPGAQPPNANAMGEWNDDDRARAWRDAFDAMHQRAMKAESKLAEAAPSPETQLIGVDLSTREDVTVFAPHPPQQYDGPGYLDFITPDEVFDQGPDAVKRWQEDYRAKLERRGPKNSDATEGDNG